MKSKYLIIFLNRSCLFFGLFLTFIINAFPKLNKIYRIFISELIVILFALDALEFSMLKILIPYFRNQTSENKLEIEIDSKALTPKEIDDFVLRLKETDITGENVNHLNSLQNTINKKLKKNKKFKNLLN